MIIEILIIRLILMTISMMMIITMTIKIKIMMKLKKKTPSYTGVYLYQKVDITANILAHTNITEKSREWEVLILKERCFSISKIL